MQMDHKYRITKFAIGHPVAVTVIMVAFTVGLAALIPLIRVDTDPENMLAGDEPARVFHNKVKRDFALYDMVVLGVVNEKDPNGVFNAESLGKIYELTEFAKSELRWPDKNDPNRMVGVVEAELLAPSTVDYIGQGGPGTVRFEWLMKTPPKDDAEALAIRDKALSNPLLKGTVVSEDGKALCIYLPLTSKDLSHKVYRKLQEKIAGFEGDERYHITGLPVAEDTFGYEMFLQMAVSAPLAMVVIFVLMLIFFRKLILIISPMIIAMVSVLSTMGLLIGLGYPVHIMSSMIPIFLMPIAVVDSVHILSEFFDRYRKERGRRQTVTEVMGHLFTPMLYTSLTSAAGFASLALTPIPPVQVFGIFVAVGIMIAWVFTVTFVPAYVMLLKEKWLENFGALATHEEKQTLLGRILSRMGRFTYGGAKPIMAVIGLAAAVAAYGITRININDNPIKWFARSHPIRVADEVLNEHFGGTYMAYLVLEDGRGEAVDVEYVDGLRQDLLAKLAELGREYPSAEEDIASAERILLGKAKKARTRRELLAEVVGAINEKIDAAAEESVDAWYGVADFFERRLEQTKLFEQPEMLRYVSDLQAHLKQTGLVGKSNSYSDIIKKVYQELLGGGEEHFRIPQTSRAVAQCRVQFESSHRPGDLWHFVAKDFSRANIWFQLTSGDNKDMEKVTRAVRDFLEANPAPVPVRYNWAGLTYINVVWQDKMVWGMLQSFMGSFIIVFIMMAILFRSALWGVVCMVPLSVTILMIYGMIGLAGKDYDMPVAVLSALTLGMAVDFAIHFLERARASHGVTGSWRASSAEMFGGPGRAISRNVLVIAIGFLPLLAAPLVPYKTVGIFVCAIMALSGTVTLVVLPAILRLGEKWLFKPVKEPVSATCNCAFCVIVSVGVALLVAVNLHQYWRLGWGSLGVVTLIVVGVLAMTCAVVSRRQACRVVEAKKGT